jgi:hypothetical protein
MYVLYKYTMFNLIIIHSVRSLFIRFPQNALRCMLFRLTVRVHKNNDNIFQKFFVY